MSAKNGNEQKPGNHAGIPEPSLFGEEDPLVGSTVARDRYQITRFLGEGSLSVVYLALDKSRGDNPCIVKKVHEHLLQNIKNLSKFEQRAQILLSLEHENIAKYRAIIAGGDNELYLILDEFDFESLEELLSRIGHVSVDMAVHIFKQVCQALAAGAKLGLEHRDLKPSNIMIQGEFGLECLARLMDFGMAKLLSDESQNNRSTQYITQSGAVFGSPLYLSPEQCTGKKLDSRSDIYSLGCVMYESVTGKPPFVGKNILETAYKHMNEQPRPIESQNNEALDVSMKRLETVILKCLEKEPSSRYQSVESIVADLDLIASRVTEEEWLGSAMAMKVETPTVRAVRSIPISSELILFTVTTLIVLGAASFLVTSGVSSQKIEYPEFDNNTLWTVNKQVSTDTEEGFGARQDAARDALDLEREEHGVNSREYAAALGNLVELYANSSRWAEAEKAVEQLLDVTKKIKGPWPVSDSYRILGYVTFMQDKSEKALDACQKSIALMEKDPQQQRNMIQPLRVIGDICARSGDLERGAATYEKLFAITDIVKDSQPNFHADTCSKLADMFRRLGRYADAEKYYSMALQYCNKSDGADTPFAAKSYYGLGLSLVGQSKYKEAAEAFKMGIPVSESKVGKESALTGALKKNYMEMLWRAAPLQALKTVVLGAD